MKQTFRTSCSLVLCLFLSVSLNAQGYSDGYSRVLDYLMSYPFDFLEKTEFELSGLQEPPGRMPVGKGFWSISLHQGPGGGADYNSYFKFNTGYSPLYVLISKKSAMSFGLSFSGSNALGITFNDLKSHLEQNHGVVFDRNGFHNRSLIKTGEVLSMLG